MKLIEHRLMWKAMRKEAAVSFIQVPRLELHGFHEPQQWATESFGEWKHPKHRTRTNIDILTIIPKYDLFSDYTLRIIWYIICHIYTF